MSRHGSPPRLGNESLCSFSAAALTKGTQLEARNSTWLFSRSLSRSDIQRSWTGSPAKGLTEPKPRCEHGCVVTEGSGKGATSKGTRVAGGIQFLAVVGLRSPSLAGCHSGRVCALNSCLHSFSMCPSHLTRH